MLNQFSFIPLYVVQNSTIQFAFLFQHMQSSLKDKVALLCSYVVNHHASPHFTKLWQIISNQKALFHSYNKVKHSPGTEIETKVRFLPRTTNCSQAEGQLTWPHWRKFLAQITTPHMWRSAWLGIKIEPDSENTTHTACGNYPALCPPTSHPRPPSAALLSFGHGQNERWEESGHILFKQQSRTAR